ncbi:lysin motif receptor-like kinase (LysM-RLK) [Chara braunii]|uniref:Lysin motif receptor-like kinase (LysM-RLK) n=1 Tax=Chara braunii TaxID=69332 RepID=A0A388LXS3_CHABU|nr:lysin motif receptor-like kinase (LysM-RLK) [Chara braunii]|eukprot:GBG87053.1 lysin motif receptor-like kinase (LysM-RLK) [Chara braunii]
MVFAATALMSMSAILSSAVGIPCSVAMGDDKNCTAFVAYRPRRADTWHDLAIRFAQDPVINPYPILIHGGSDNDLLTLLSLFPVPCSCNESRRQFETDIFYTVETGDSLSGIAYLKYESLLSVADMVQANGVSDPDYVRVGWRLKIAIRCACNSSSSAGRDFDSYITYCPNSTFETPADVAQRFNTTVAAIRTVNGIVGPRFDLFDRDNRPLVIPTHRIFQRPSAPPPVDATPVMPSVATPPAPSVSGPRSRSSFAVSSSQIALSVLSALVVVIFGVICALIVCFVRQLRLARSTGARFGLCLRLRPSAPRGIGDREVDKATRRPRQCYPLPPPPPPPPQRVKRGRDEEVILHKFDCGEAAAGRAVAEVGCCEANDVGRAGAEGGGRRGGMGGGGGGGGVRRDHIKRHKCETDNKVINNLDLSELEKEGRKFIVFSREELEQASNGFSSDNQIGRGSSCRVFYAQLRDREVAIKRMRLVWRRQFQKELRILSQVHHRHLVELIGFCTEQYLFLVYEYCHQGTLSSHLHSPDTCGGPLDWRTRVQIALDAAQALLYIHDRVHPAYVHCDIKSLNILLDRDLRGKVADFGVIKLIMPEGESLAAAGLRHSRKKNGTLSTKFAGTWGYMAPEYMIYGEVTPSCDVYSFGVVLLELITGQRAILPRERLAAAENSELATHVTQPPTLPATLASSVAPLIKQMTAAEDVSAIVDPRLDIAYPTDLTLQLARLAAQCVELEPDDRPEMKRVVYVLDETLSLAISRVCSSNTDDKMLAVRIAQDSIPV